MAGAMRPASDVGHQWPPSLGAPTASAGTRHQPFSNASHRTRSPRKTGPSTQERTIRVAPSLPVDRHHTGHADPDAAGHRLLDGDLGDGALGGGDLGDRAQHAHRAAAVDDAGAGAADDLGQHVGDPAPVPAEPSSVVTVTPSAQRAASTTPNSRSSLAAPSTISTRQPRSRSGSASQNSGALP